MDLSLWMKKMNNKYELTFKNRTFSIEKALADKYERMVRPLNENGINYIFSVFELDVSSEQIEQDFSNALKEELEVAFELPTALEEALENGILDKSSGKL